MKWLVINSSKYYLKLCKKHQNVKSTGSELFYKQKVIFGENRICKPWLLLHIKMNLFHIMNPTFLHLFPSLCLFLQYKKHRLSVGLTNNYAKSVVNMADMVRIVLIFFLKACHKHSQVLELSAHCTDFSFNQPHSLHLKPLLVHNMLRAAINQPVMSFQRPETAVASHQYWGRYLYVSLFVATSVCCAAEIWPATGSCLKADRLRKGHAFCRALEEDHMKPTLFGTYTLISMSEFGCLLSPVYDVINITAITCKTELV